MSSLVVSGLILAALYPLRWLAHRLEQEAPPPPHPSALRLPR
jgi:hypothetical protein